MADEQHPSLSIDTDWKKQAQEEKRRLAEEAQRKAAAAAAAAAAAGPSPLPPPGAPIGPPAPGARPGTPRGAAAAAAPRGRRELPPASFATLVQSIVTQILFYLGDLSPQGGEPMLNLDMAKHQLDVLTMLEEKTVNNLTPDEKQMLDAALYEARMRYVNVASQYI
jgi:hypothetical protein